MKAVLGLEDGTCVEGEGFGVEGECAGELVFCTSMTGYMEALTDPSYHGQILMFTYPLVGNYGVDHHVFQSTGMRALGCVVREVCREPSCGLPITRYFQENGHIGITGVDTRSLTIRIREHGTMRAVVMCGDVSAEEAVEKARKVPDICSLDLIPDVSCREPFRIPGKGKRIAVLDLGIKNAMLKSLHARGTDLYLFPFDATPDQVAAVKPQAIFVSNGPGDPVRATATIRTVREFLGEIPVFGICFGNQIIGLAVGGKTHKMKFGHRGSNQPVRDAAGNIYITTQNHGFVVDADSLPEGCRVSYTNVNDGTLEGFEDPYLNAACVQFHPEAYAGPRDTEITFFDEIVRRIP